MEQFFLCVPINAKSFNTKVEIWKSVVSFSCSGMDARSSEELFLHFFMSFLSDEAGH